MKKSKRNEQIHSILKTEYDRLWNFFSTQSFEDIIKSEINKLEDTHFIPTPHISQKEMKAKAKAELMRILTDKNLLEYFDNFHQRIASIDEEALGESIKTDIEVSFQRAKENRKSNHPLSILILEYDWDYKAGIHGYGKGDFEHQILSEPAYLKYDYQKEVIYGIGIIDYSLGMQPIINIENEIDEEKLEIVMECLEFEYYPDLIRMFILNTYLILHDEMLYAKGAILDSGLNLEKEIFIYSCEHDCEFNNICVIEH